MVDWAYLLSVAYGSNKIVDKNIDDSIFNDSDYELMQFTGALSDGGKELYEGDIIIFRDDEGDFIPRMRDSESYEVYWDNQKHSWGGRREQCGYADKYDTRILGWNYYNYRIVGNIFENPELMK